ncbi:hypothetical protein REPUB_Repub11eG0114100 [Reevesia pubescens]
MASHRSDTAEALLIRVDPSRKGDYRKIQDAIDVVPSNNKEVVFILVKPVIEYVWSWCQSSSIEGIWRYGSFLRMHDLIQSGIQDTLLEDTGIHYYINYYIEGAVDFICGNAASLFERCHLHSLSEGDAAITAQRRMSPSEDTGFTFLGCKVTGVRTALLGRAWGPYSKVIFALTYMSNVVLPQGWNDWGDSSKQR